MAEKDITEKILEDYNDVFADIVNNLIFHGQTVVHDDELENSKDKSQYKADDTKMHEQERDTCKFWKNFNIRIALFGIENQTEREKYMPFRTIGYDGASYRSQLLQDPIECYPVITLVLYFGTKRWSKYRSLSDICDVPEELKPYFNDYRINVFEIAYLSDEQVAGFKSDFRIVADYFVQKRKNNNYVPTTMVIKHVDEVLKMMTVLTNSNSFENIINDLSEGGDTSMCEVMDRIESEAEARGEARGKIQGEIKGKIEGKIEGKVLAYHDMNLKISEIAEKCHITEDEVTEILSKES